MLRIVEQWHASDVGRQRHGNEDSRYVRAPLFVVADGMGGAQAGEVASAIAVRAFEDGLPGTGQPGEQLARLIEAANERIHERSRSDGRLAGMGTTITATYVGEETVTLAHVGDSRCYLLRNAELTRLSKDHSLVGELVERGRITAEEAETHPQRSVITRALGPEPHVQVDLDTFPARDGDVFLICSDGLTDMVAEPQLAELLRADGSLETRGRTLIDAANDAGGRDNITVVLFRLEEVARGGAVAVGAADEEAPTSEYEALPSSPATQVMDLPQTDEHERLERPGAAAAPERTRAGDEPPSPRRRRKRRRRLVNPATVIGLVVLLGLLAAAWSATREVYFVGVDQSRGNVITIYRGLPYDGPFGIELYSPVVHSGVTYASVPAARRATFTDHKLRSRDDARTLVLTLERGELTP